MRATAVEELGTQARLAGAGLGHHAQHLAVAAPRSLEGGIQDGHVAAAANEGGESTRARTVEPRPKRADAGEVEQTDWRRGPFHLRAAEILKREVPFDESRRVLATLIRLLGDFDLARSLASLAWEGRRRDLFETEFVDLLKMVDSGVPRSQLHGSYAGAFGNPQFLPSVYLRLAVDADGDGRKDIWNDRADTLASIANYFRDAGWRAGQPWGVRASVPPGFDVGAWRGKLMAPTCPRVHERFSQWKTVAEWRRLGVVPQAPIGETVLTSLFQPDGPGTRAWLLTGNYRVILEYNCSNYYAMSVGLLADEIAQ